MYKAIRALPLACLILIGCASTTQPPQVPFPRPPADLLVPAQQLKAAPEKPSAASVLPVVTGNYSAFHVVAERLTALQAWVRKQFETTNGQPLN